ncbi:MAG: hypothetical protein FWH34_01045, partial [Desulfovibrionaceae bacterium]|nr:hypothetical protein [Desulfovibrionaceae bacterium]
RTCAWVNFCWLFTGDLAFDFCIFTSGTDQSMGWVGFVDSGVLQGAFTPGKNLVFFPASSSERRLSSESGCLFGFTPSRNGKTGHGPAYAMSPWQFATSSRPSGKQ